MEVTSRRSASLGLGSDPSTRRDWILISAVGPNLLTTAGTDEEGVKELHLSAIKRVEAAMEAAALAGRSTTPAPCQG